MSTSSPPPSEREPYDRSALVGLWLKALAPTGFMSVPRAVFVDSVRAHLDAMAAAMATAPLSVAAGQRAGAGLVAAGFTDAEGLRASLRVLATGLLECARADGRPDPAGRAFAMLAALGAGYTSAMRDWLFDQQEEVKQALQRATGEAERRLKLSEAWFREVFVRAAVGIAISDSDGRLTLANPALAEILGCQPDDLVGRSLGEFFHAQETDDIRSDYHDLGRIGAKPLRRRRRLIRTDGQLVWCYLAVSVLRDDDDVPTLHLTMVENVSDLHLLQDLTSYQTLHDVLTGLPNRQYLLSQLQSQLAYPNADRHITLYHLDLDGFAAINHGLGPEYGDRLLLVVARRLENQLTAQKVLVARLTADEFAVLCTNGSEPAGVLDTIAEINELLAEPVHLPGGGVGLSASIGVAHGRPGEIEPFELLRRAEISLRRAQATGNRQWAEFDQHRDVGDRRRATLASTLSGALEFGELTTFWQPWHTLAGGALVGVSIRAAWNHPEHGMVEHEECVDLAELTGAASSLATWLIDVACEQVRHWWDRFHDETLRAGVPLSVHQIADPDLVATIGTAIEKAGIEPDLLTLSVPTAALRSENGDARDNIAVLTSMGVHVLLGDAGLAPEELPLLDERPLAAVHLAEPLVREVAAGGPESRLAKAVGALVRTLWDTGLPVVVSGLCAAAEVEWWLSVGALLGCGPYFSVPVGADELTDMLAERRLPPGPSA